MKRLLHPATNMTGLLSAASAIYAAIQMLWNAYHTHTTVIDPKVIVAALAAAGYLLSRFYVTPLADPKNGAGQKLAPVGAVYDITVPSPTGTVPPATTTGPMA